jgi:3',5'-cyclic AMP phosphodiesterase CpdA
MNIPAFIQAHAVFLAHFGAAALLILLLYELWEDLREWLEDYWVKKLRRSVPRHVNISAVRDIMQRLNGRSSFKFAVIGDTQNKFKPFRKILSRMAGDNIDFIIHAGDFTSSGRYMQYIKMLRFIKTIDVPIVFAMGNHDISNRGTECFVHFMGPVNFYFDCGLYRFIFLNNTRKEFVSNIYGLPQAADFNKPLRGMDVEQVHNLDMALQGRARNFIVMHTPPAFDAYKHHGFNRNLDRFISVMKKHSPQVARVFCGHIHGFSELVVDNVHYIVSGGAGDSLHASREGITNKSNYVLVSIADNTVTHQARFIS